LRPAGHCSGTANITLPPSALPSFVHLNLTCNVVSIQQGQVLEVFERAIMAFSRPSDPEHENGDQQVGWNWNSTCKVKQTCMHKAPRTRSDGLLTCQ
jgi:hypothetical protein